MWITVHDSFGAPGDTLLTGIVCRHIAGRFPRIKINCITPNPELLAEDPHIARLNGPETYICLRHWYLEQIENKIPDMNVLAESFRTLGIADYDYRASVYLTEKEKAEGMERLSGLTRPLVSLNARSKEPVKTWPADHWQRLVTLLRPRYDLVQLGDGTEPALDGVRSFAGKLTLRESMAVLSHAKTHIGSDSFLMHAANGLRVPSVILFGGSRTVENAGYAGNINLYVPMPCGPCYIHQSRGQTCAHGVECMDRITVEMVSAGVLKLMGEGIAP
jgi:ADP-heptose:LPS heptosyltransferase